MFLLLKTANNLMLLTQLMEELAFGNNILVAVLSGVVSAYQDPICIARENF